MNYTNLEKYIILVNFSTKQISEFEFIRRLNPLLIERIIRNLPIKAFTLFLKNRLLLKINIPFSASRKTFIHKRGDISYDPIQQALVIYFKNNFQDNFEKIGIVSKGLDFLEKLKSGNFVILEK